MIASPLGLVSVTSPQVAMWEIEACAHHRLTRPTGNPSSTTMACEIKAVHFLGCGERLDLTDAFPDGSLGVPKIHRTLSVEPELRRVAKKARKPKCHLRSYCAPLSKQFIDGLARNPQCTCEARHGQPIVRQEIFPQHYSGVGGADFSFSCVFNAHRF